LAEHFVVCQLDDDFVWLSTSHNIEAKRVVAATKTDVYRNCIKQQLLSSSPVHCMQIDWLASS